MSNMVWFRNDDVRDALDSSLVEITDIFLRNGVPISHAVEPGNVTPEVIDWLRDLKSNHPDLIEIVQHGYNHCLNYSKVIGGTLQKGEFGGDRNYQEQYQDIVAGKELMNQYFGDLWFPSFTFPYSGRNPAAIRALSDAGFKVINGSYRTSVSHQIFYIIGRLLRQKILLGKRISYNLRKVPGTALFEIDMNFSFIKMYYEEGTKASFHDLKTLEKKFKQFRGQKTIGILLHHRYHNTPDKIRLVEDLIKGIKRLEGIEFLTQEKIYRTFI